jgi:hypothetical protein
MEDLLSVTEQAEYQTLVAKANASGDMEELKQFVNDKVFCRRDGTPANFGDGSHYTCPATGGKKKKRKSSKKGTRSKTHPGRKNYTTKKGDKVFHRKKHYVRKSRKPYTKKGGKKSKKSKKSRKGRK